MKYIVMLGDGMADYPVEALGGRTPLETAKKPNIDRLARYGELGMVKTVPNGMKPGSDVANLAAMGYDPECYRALSLRGSQHWNRHGRVRCGISLQSCYSVRGGRLSR